MSSSGKIKRRKHIEYGKYGYLFIAPFFIVYLIFSLWPLIYTVYLSLFNSYERNMEEFSEFVGLGNFVEVLGVNSDTGLFGTKTFEALGNTVIIWIINFIPQILLALLLAVWLTDTKAKLKGQGVYKIMIYMPNIITAATISVLFYTLFNNTGAITGLLRNLHIIPESFNFMESPMGTRGIIAFIQFWMWYGNTMLLLIAGILGISPSLFEAANIDGANGFRIFKSITLPCLKPIVLYVLVTSAIGGLQMYDIPALFNVTNGGDGLPNNASTTITMYIKQLSNAKNMGKAATASMVLFVVTLVISLLFFFFLSDRERKPKKIKTKKGVV